MDISKKLKIIIQNISNEPISIDDINAQTNLIDDLSLDSIQLLQLIIDIEREFKIEISDEVYDQDQFTKYSELVNIIRRNQSQNQD